MLIQGTSITVTYKKIEGIKKVYYNNGEMRNATPEEQASINKYIKSISRDTGVNFFDIC